MKRIITPFLLLLLSLNPAWAQQKTTTTQKPATPPNITGRYHIVPEGSTLVKIDTWTGDSWKAITCPSDLQFNVRYTAAIGGCWAKMPEIDP